MPKVAKTKKSKTSSKKASKDSLAEIKKTVAEAEECLAAVEKQTELEERYATLLKTCKGTPPPLPAKRLVLQAREGAEDSSSEEESDEEESSEESEEDTKKGKKVEKKDESSEEESSDDDDDDDDDEESSDDKKKPAAKKEESSDEESDDDDDDDDDDEESSDEEESSDDEESEKKMEVEPVKNNKRKAEEDAPPAKKAKSDDGENQDVFVGNLSFDVDEALLYETFVGATQVRLPVFQDSGKPRGFAFIAFATKAEADAACAKFNETQLLGRPLNVRLANEGGAGGGAGRPQRAAEGTECFMGNLSWDIDDNSLKSWLGDIPLASVRWIEKDGQFTGCGFARFNSTDDAQRAAKKNGEDCLGRPIRIEVAKPRTPGGGGGGRGGRGGSFGGGGGGRNSFGGGGGRRF